MHNMQHGILQCLKHCMWECTQMHACSQLYCKTSNECKHVVKATDAPWEDELSQAAGKHEKRFEGGESSKQTFAVDKWHTQPFVAVLDANRGIGIGVRWWVARE